MSTRAELLRTIIDDPESDTPRLVFADWLDEHGEPERAEFIRVQIELARIDSEGGKEFAKYGLESVKSITINAATESLRYREKELLRPNANRWADHLPGGPWMLSVFDELVGQGRSVERAICYRHSRGFVGQVEIAWNDWLKHFPAILVATPLHEVCLTTLPAWTWVCEETLEDTPQPSSIIRLVGLGFDGIAAVDLNLPLTTRMLACLARAWPRLKFTLPQYQYETVNDASLRPEHRGASVGMRLPFARD